MNEYETKPVTVNAYQWKESMGASEGVVENPKGYTDLIDYYECTGDGQPMTEGDWIVKEKNGKYHSCSDSFFKEHYSLTYMDGRVAPI